MRGFSLSPVAHLVGSVLCQVIGVGIGWGLQSLALPFFLSLLMAAASAAGCAFFIRLPKGWVLFNALCLPAIYLSLSSSFSDLTIWFLVLAVLFFMCIFLPTFWTRVPYYPTSRKTYEEVAKLLPKGKSFSFIDIGCGFSGLLVHLAKRFPEGRFYGNEISMLPFLVSFFRTLRHRNVQIGLESFWKNSWETYDVVYAFLAPPPMADVWAKAQSEMPAGTLLISNSFPAPTNASQVVEIADYRPFTLYVYRL